MIIISVMAEFVLAKPIEFVSAITRTSSESLGLKVCDEIEADIKPAEVLMDE